MRFKACKSMCNSNVLAGSDHEEYHNLCRPKTLNKREKKPVEGNPRQNLHHLRLALTPK